MCAYACVRVLFARLRVWWLCMCVHTRTCVPPTASARVCACLRVLFARVRVWYLGVCVHIVSLQLTVCARACVRVFFVRVLLHSSTAPAHVYPFPLDPQLHTCAFGNQRTTSLRKRGSHVLLLQHRKRVKNFERARQHVLHVGRVVAFSSASNVLKNQCFSSKVKNKEGRNRI